MDRRFYIHSTTVLALVLLYFPMLVSPSTGMAAVLPYMAFPSVVILVLMAAGFFRSGAADLGLQTPAGRDWFLVPLLVVLSVSIGLIIPMDGSTAAPGSPWAYLSFAFLAVIAAMTEELFFRSWMLSRYTKLVGTVPAVLLSSALFSVGHLYQGIPAVFFAFGMGIAYSLTFLRRGSFWIIAASHSIHNLLAIPLPDIR